MQTGAKRGPGGRLALASAAFFALSALSANAQSAAALTDRAPLDVEAHELCCEIGCGLRPVGRIDAVFADAAPVYDCRTGAVVDHFPAALLIGQPVEATETGDLFPPAFGVLVNGLDASPDLSAPPARAGCRIEIARDPSATVSEFGNGLDC